MARYLAIEVLEGWSVQLMAGKASMLFERKPLAVRSV